MKLYPKKLPLKRINISGLFIFLSAFSITVKAQSLLTPEQTVEIILKNNYNVSIARNDAEIASLAATRGNAGMLPSVYLNGNGTVQSTDINQRYSSGLVVKNNGVGANNVNAQFGMIWTLFDGGQMFYTYDRLKQQEQGAQLSLRQQLEFSVEQALNSYYTIVRLKQEVQAMQFGLDVSEEQLLFANTRFEVGNGSRQLVLQATVDRNTWRSQLLEKHMQLDNAGLELNRLLARDLSLEFDVADSIPVQYTPSLPDLQQKSANVNASVLLSENNSKIAGYQVKELRAGYLPQLNLLAAYGLTRASSQSGFSLYNYSQGPSAGLQFTWNLFNGNQQRSLVRQYDVRLKTADLLVNDARATVSADVLIAYRTWRSASEIRELEEQNFDAAKENVSLALERQRVGSADILTVKEAQRSYEEAITRVTTSRYTAKQAELALMRLSGELVK